MAELRDLSHDERVLLAGCMRAVMLADGSLQEGELKDLDRIYRRLDFHDYEACLDEFEEKYPDEESVMRAAGKVRNPGAQDLILKTMYELTVQNGAPEDAQESILMKLSRIWDRT